MDVLHNLAFGFEHALTLQNLMFCAIGCTVGTLVGLLPGLGPLATISLLLPLTYSIPTGGALIMLAGIYYGAQYGDSVSAITMKIPHASSIVACIDGYQMTLKGKTGLALFTPACRASSAARWRSSCCPFLAPEPGRRWRSCSAGRLLRADAGGLRLRELRHHRQPAQRHGDVPDRRAARQIGTDVNSGVPRFTMDLPFLPTASASSAWRSAASALPRSRRTSTARESARPFNGKINLMPTWAEFKRIIPSACAAARSARSSASCPAAGPVIAQFAAYASTRRSASTSTRSAPARSKAWPGQAAPTRPPRAPASSR
jgi:TctA family transporter